MVLTCWWHRAQKESWYASVRTLGAQRSLQAYSRSLNLTARNYRGINVNLGARFKLQMCTGSPEGTQLNFTPWERSQSLRGFMSAHTPALRQLSVCSCRVQKCGPQVRTMPGVAPMFDPDHSAPTVFCLALSLIWPAHGMSRNAEKLRWQRTWGGADREGHWCLFLSVYRLVLPASEDVVGI